jgi:signal transduction histidine kinase
MIPVSRKLSRFIPATYFLIVLFPIILVSLIWVNNLLNLNEVQKQQVEQRFYNSHKKMVEHEVDSIVDSIDKVRDETRTALIQQARDYMSITMRIAQVVYEAEHLMHSKETLSQHAVDDIEPVLIAEQFDSLWIFDHEKKVLYRSEKTSNEDTINFEEECVQSALNQPGKAKLCELITQNNKQFTFIIEYFDPLDLLVVIGVSHKQIEEKARQRVLAMISDVRYGEGGQEYLFAFQYDGIYLSHPEQKYIGMNLIDIKDPNGVEINRELVRTAQQGGGYVYYVWDRYKTGTLVDKVSYARGYPDWGWVIGTGFYLDTLFERQSKQDDLLSDLLKEWTLYGVLMMLGLLAISVWVALRIFKGFNQELAHFNTFFLRKVDEAEPIELDRLYFDEFRDLARSGNAMLAARQKAEQQLIDVFNSMDDVIYIADPQTYELLFVNAAFERQYGENTLGQKCFKTLQGLDAPCDFCSNPFIFGANLGNAHVWQIENKVDKRWYDIVDRAILWHDGRYVRFQHARDITEQKQAEIEREHYQAKLELAVEKRTQELQAKTDQLQQANNDLEGFSYSVSHDLRSPLRAIDGFVAILTDEYGDKLDEEGFRLFGIVQDNARKMGELIDDILAFSRAGRLEIERQHIDMTQLVKSVWKNLQGQYSDRNIDFRCNDLPAVEADPNAIRQVLSNLISNAVKFSAASDPIVIEVKGKVIDGYIRYSVSDNGVGFSDEYKGKLFVMFQRLHGMDEFDGTGVGLAIVKRFIQKHGGRVDAQATPGDGATFIFELPSSIGTFDLTPSG